MRGFREENGTLIWEMNHETVVIQPWGRGSLRVRSTKGATISDTPWALLPPAASGAKIEFDDNGAVIENGKIIAEVSRYERIRFLKAEDGSALLEEAGIRYGPIRHAARYYRPESSDLIRLEVLTRSAGS